MTSTSKFTRSNSALPTPHARLKQGMQDCRSLTLSLFESMNHDTFCRQVHPDLSPVGWHLGHIAYTEALWILQRCAGDAPLFPEYHRLFAQDGLPKGDRVHLPPLSEVQNYLGEVRSRVFDYLEIAPLDKQEPLWRWLLQHESQHAETMTIVLELQKRQAATQNSNFDSADSPAAKAQSSKEMVCIPAGYFEQGNESLDALDNERPVQHGYLETYWIDRTPVTCGEYRSFLQAAGYQNPLWWSAEGWQWQQENLVTEPLYWLDAPIYEDHPVCGVSGYEAEAYARFVGKRLPTEAEWEKAASWNPEKGERTPPVQGTCARYPWGNQPPSATRCNYSHFQGMTSAVGQYPKGRSHYGCDDLLGNVWEWTASWFEGYSGFESYPYPNYSQIYFDGAHRVLKGGSWATFPWALRSTFRNWYHPHVRQILAGFRCVRDAA